jgi:hypothetical protein
VTVALVAAGVHIQLPNVASSAVNVRRTRRGCSFFERDARIPQAGKGACARLGTILTS